MTKDEALKLALEALELYYDLHEEDSDAKAITAIREALAQPEQEPVAWITRESKWRLSGGGNAIGTVPVHAKQSNIAIIPLYCTSRQRKPLTDEEIGRIAGETLDPWSCARAIEAAHGIKENT